MMSGAPGSVLGLFAKYPEPGRTKSRLAADIGDIQAAKLSACFTCDLISRLPAMADETVVAAASENAACRAWFEARLAARTRLVFQPPGNLGERVSWFFRQFAATGARIVLIGSDSPDLPSSLIAEAFESLLTADVVAAPAADGGFVLVGLKDDPGVLFEGIRWSSEDTFNDLVAATDRTGRSLRTLSSWYDVDTIQDLELLSKRLVLPPVDADSAVTHPFTGPCPETLQCLREMSSAGTDLEKQ